MYYMGTLIIGLIIAIALCVLLLIIFSISDAVKKHKNKNKNDRVQKAIDIEQPTTTKEVASLLENNANSVDATDVVSPFGIDNLINNLKKTSNVSEDSVEEKLDNTGKGELQKEDTQHDVLDREEPSITKEAIDNSESAFSSVSDSDKDKNTAEINKTPEQEIDKTIFEAKTAETTKDESKTIGSYRELLERLAREYQQSLIRNDVVAIKYLSENCIDLNYEKGSFNLRNEEIIVNGFIQEEDDIYNVKAGDTIIIRFCVNFSIPDDYTIKIEADELALKSKRLELVNISNAPDSNTSIRATVSALADGTINKWEKLFSVRVMKEVVL